MKKILSFETNTQGEDWFVGDIHGEYTALEKQLNERGFNPATDRLFCTGDLIDRGRESPRAVEFLEKDWFYSVLGNHDNFVIEDHENEYLIKMWQWEGGSWWDKLKVESLKEQFITLFSKLPHLIEIETPLGKVGIVHGEVPLNIPSWNQLKENLDDNGIIESLLWGRKRIRGEIRQEVQDIDIVVSGHTTIVDPVRLANSVFIDNRGYLLQQFILLSTTELFDSRLSENMVYIK